jgi:hypothetical protein
MACIVEWIYTGEYTITDEMLSRRPPRSSPPISDSDDIDHGWHLQEPFPRELFQLDIYFIADMFFLEGLKSKAIPQCRLGEMLRHYDEAGQLVDHILEKTQSHCQLRKGLILTIAEGWQWIDQCRDGDAILESLRKHEPMVVEVCTAVHERFRQARGAPVLTEYHEWCSSSGDW